jgi:hypothetical protein
MQRRSPPASQEADPRPCSSEPGHDRVMPIHACHAPGRWARVGRQNPITIYVCQTDIIHQDTRPVLLDRRGVAQPGDFPNVQGSRTSLINIVWVAQ